MVIGGKVDSNSLCIIHTTEKQKRTTVKLACATTAGIPSGFPVEGNPRVAEQP